MHKYYLWFIPMIVYYIIYSWLSKQNNSFGGKWFWLTFTWGILCPFWLIISRYSRNLIFDGMLYDIIMFSTYVLTMAALGVGAKFSLINWLGVVIVSIGFFLMQVPK